MDDTRKRMAERAAAIARHGGIEQAVRSRALPQFSPVSVSEAVVLGLYNQGVRKYAAVFGHGSTDLANVLSVYETAGLVRTFALHNEIEASHCAAMLRWHYGEIAAVVTSIGPGALQALSGSIAAASNGIGLYYIFGDETTHGEGPNMQAIPTERQHSFLTLASTAAAGYTLHTPHAVFAALRKGASTVFHPGFASPFYILMPMNVQPEIVPELNLLELPASPSFAPTAVQDPSVFEEAVRLIRGSRAITIKFGGGAAGCGAEIRELAELVDGVIVSGAKMSGVVPYSERRFMSVGGSKGSISGNHAMEEADLVIVVGARAVCQWDCSGTAWRKARAIINFNMEPSHANHYNQSLPVLGDARCNLRSLISRLKENGFRSRPGVSEWLRVNQARKEEWQRVKRSRFDCPALPDTVWKREVLTQPAAIRVVYEFARARGAARYFDAGDVQANGFQIVEDEEEGLTFSETGSSYMGFAASALLAGAMAERPVYAFAFSGDGSFLMNPQILVDGAEHLVRGCIVVFDNRRMGAITALQLEQYGAEYRTSASVGVDFVMLARAVEGVNALFGGYTESELGSALEEAYAYPGLSLVHVPVYAGPDERGGLGAYGRWNVGSWCDALQAEHHRIGL